MNVHFITQLFNSRSLEYYYRVHKKHVEINTVKSWIRQILLELEYLHIRKLSIIHRDVKCDNIFINKNMDQVKIEAMEFPTTMSKESLDRILGTPSYMVPKTLDMES
uniref:non-specific serine/threonine protein kinase n=1 Tax=Physcomitrium patens TaxID=3218 RepID=A0A2K1KJF0_PHYPA|nr:hypothetical protein PHYPA_007581 [Physcomitrium patens]